jgi:RNA polymerase sigma-70 factor, ECF subfamily
MDAATNAFIAPPVKQCDDTTVVPLPQPAGEELRAMTARMKAGDEQAFILFHDRYCDRLFRYLFVLCRTDEPLARDLLQTTMLKVARSIRAFDDEPAFWNWLAAIARNNFLDHLRKQRRLPRLDPLAHGESALVLVAPEHDTDAALHEALDHALAQLPAEDRVLIENFYFQSGTYRSVAAEQNTSSKAIESKLARVRQKLRRAIAHYLRYENC